MIILIYCAAIAAVSLLGGYVPLASRINHRSMQYYLSFSAGAMLGAAFFHMLPESAELAGHQFGLWAICGVIGLYVIERFISPHSHDANGYAGQHQDHAHPHHSEHGPNGHVAARDTLARGRGGFQTRPYETRGVVEFHGNGTQRHSAAPHIAGWSAVAGLSIHTFLGGLALGSAVLGSDASRDVGLAVFLATVFHKPADAFTISTLLLKGGTSRERALLVQVLFAGLIPLGVLFFYLGRSLLATPLESAFTGSVMAFSAGTFLCIALSDLLPEVQFHSHDRVGLFLSVIGGAAMMYGTSLFES